MHFYELIKEMAKNQKIDLYVDMDGVISAYEIGKPLEFFNKRPMLTNIEILKKISLLKNVQLHILSICITDNQIQDKNDWLDKYAPFFEQDKRIIISKESNPNQSSAKFKLNFLKSVNKKNQLVLVDDDNNILHIISKELKDIILYQDSELVD